MKRVVLRSVLRVPFSRIILTLKKLPNFLKYLAIYLLYNCLCSSLCFPIVGLVKRVVLRAPLSKIMLTLKKLAEFWKMLTSLIFEFSEKSCANWINSFKGSLLDVYMKNVINKSKPYKLWQTVLMKYLDRIFSSNLSMNMLA